MSAEPGPAGPATALPTAARWTAREAREIVCGGAVIVVLALVLAYSYGGGRVSSAVGAYTLTANFNRVDGLAEGADVFLAGIKVGTVIDLSIDAGTYDAVVSMSVADGFPRTPCAGPFSSSQHAASTVIVFTIRFSKSAPT